MKTRKSERRRRLYLGAWALLRRRGIVVKPNTGWKGLVLEVEKIAGINAPPELGMSGARMRTIAAMRLISKEQPSELSRRTHKERLVATAKRKQIPSGQPSQDDINDFYKSYEWRKLRYSVLVKYGSTCMCCGKVGGVTHVDHIRPLRKSWSLRLKFDNLQVLCDECNHGKGNWSEIDFRPDLLPTVVESM